MHPSLPLHLVSAITARLAAPGPAAAPNSDFGADAVSLEVALSEPSKTDPSYDLCLASWAKWLVDNCHTSAGAADPEEVAELRESIIVRIVSALRPDRVEGGASKA